MYMNTPIHVFSGHLYFSKFHSWFQSAARTDGSHHERLFLGCSLRKPLELHKSQASFQVVRGNTGLLSSHCRWIRSHLVLRGNLVGFLELWQGPQGTCRVASGKSGFLSNCKGHFRFPVQSLQGNRASSCVEAGNSGFISSCDRDLRVPIEFQQGSQASSLVEAWNFAFLLSCKRCQASYRVEAENSGFF